ncbi:hypothetical protein [Nocardioides sambongensis]|uniref:hypothetical protein n=1 Tax=Nocardioides sambongensis TaxID=2589074 RepID=UPI0011293588|nr:hypothetical protein [Nocardioides sambongensis]
MSDEELGLVSAALTIFVILIGLIGIAAAAFDKPKLNVGLTEILLSKLPDLVWRVVMLVIGIAVIALGVGGLLAGQR